MRIERIKEIYADFKNALIRLNEALSKSEPASDIVIDATIQRFEFTFELAWKLAKVVLEYNGVDVMVPRLVIKEAFKAKMLKDGDGWIDMLEDRNRTSHIYDEKQALVIHRKIQNNYINLFEDFKVEVETVLQGLKET